MYEIWSLGHKPFEGYTNAQVRCMKFWDHALIRNSVARHNLKLSLGGAFSIILIGISQNVIEILNYVLIWCWTTIILSSDAQLGYFIGNERGGPWVPSPPSPRLPQGHVWAHDPVLVSFCRHSYKQWWHFVTVQISISTHRSVTQAPRQLTVHQPVSFSLPTTQAPWDFRASYICWHPPETLSPRLTSPAVEWGRQGCSPGSIHTGG